MLFITLCTGWILKKRTRKLVVLQKYRNSENKRTQKNVYISPLTPIALRRALCIPRLTPDQPPFKGGRYVMCPCRRREARL